MQAEKNRRKKRGEKEKCDCWVLLDHTLLPLNRCRILTLLCVAPPTTQHPLPSPNTKTPAPRQRDFEELLQRRGGEDGVLADVVNFGKTLAEVDFHACEKVTPSYRVLPPDYPLASNSGRAVDPNVGCLMEGLVSVQVSCWL